MKYTKWNNYEVGDVIVSLVNLLPHREVGSIFKIISLDSVMYYKPHTNSSSPEEWRPATEQEINGFNLGITNISMIKTNIEQYEIY